ncbi:MAG: c-type cytochrome [Fibrobacteria bacterium]|nr:c-type cytochrome [Fibrobacteria bacterium]
MRIGLFILIAVVCCFAREPRLGTEAEREAGKIVYMKKCASCHGKKGDGKGNVFGFKPVPRDFTLSSYKLRSTPSGELPTHEDLKGAVKKGMPYTGMLAWPDLSEEDLDNVVYFLKSYDETFSDPDYLVDPLPLPEAPPFSEESAKNGFELYKKNKCFDCHGDIGRGNGPSAPTTKDSYQKPLRPADLTKRWTFRNGPTRKEMYRSLLTGLDGTPMASYKDLMKPEEIWNVVDYVYSISNELPNFTTLALASAIDGDIDLSLGDSLFVNAEAANFPVFGQIMEPGREFFPGINAVEVKAVYDTASIAIMLTYHDMSMQINGSNDPTAEVPLYTPDWVKPTDSISDAVAIQIPSKMPDGFIKPYFLFGDKKRSVDIWFADLAKKEADVYVGKGSKKLVKQEKSNVEVVSSYDDGVWKVIFKRPRRIEKGLPFEVEQFIPIALSFWDGHEKNRGNYRCVTSWYNIYLKPAKEESPFLPAAKTAIWVLVIELLIVFFVRRRSAKSPE